MGLFEDINEMLSNGRDIIDFEKQVEELSNSVISRTNSIKMMINPNPSGSTTNDKSSNHTNGSANKVITVRKLVKKDEVANDIQGEIEEDNSENANIDSELKLKSNVAPSEGNKDQEHYHIKLPDISTIRDGVVWSEILGPPRCKRRYQRYKSK